MIAAGGSVLIAVSGCQPAPKAPPLRLNTSVAVVRPAPPKHAPVRKKKPVACDRTATGLTQERKDELFRMFSAEHDPAVDPAAVTAENASTDTEKPGLPPCPPSGR